MRLSDVNINISYPISEVEKLKVYLNKGCANFQLTDEEIKKLFIIGNINKQVGEYSHEIEFSADEDITDVDNPDYPYCRDISITYEAPVIHAKHDTFEKWQSECFKEVDDKANKYIKNIITHILNNENIDGIQTHRCYINNRTRIGLNDVQLRQCLEYLLKIDIECLSISIKRKDQRLDTFHFFIKHGMGITMDDMKQMHESGDIYSLLSALLGHDDMEEDEDE